MASGICKSCRHGKETKLDGSRPPHGTVWCSKKQFQMGQNRKMQCFEPLGGMAARHCVECKWAKHVLPHGGVPEPGSIWCDRRHFEVQKLRKMSCFEHK